MTPQLLQLVGALFGLGAFACYVIAVIQMFKHGKTGPGLFSTLGLLLCGIGYLFAFIYGWIKAGEWRIKNVMAIWSVCLALNIVLNAAAFPGLMQQAQQMQQQNVGVPAPAAP